MTKVSDGSVGGAIETTVVFPPATTVTKLAKMRADTKKRVQSVNGELGQEIGKAVEEKHLNRKAHNIACELQALPDEKLHIVYMHLMKYLDDLGVVKRATAQEEMFSPDEVDEPTGAFKDAAPAEANGKGGAKKNKGKGGDNVTPIKPGRATAETAGEKLN